MMSLVLIVSLSGCASLKSLMGEVKGNLIVRSFVISEYDHFANKTLELSGSKVTVGLLKNSANFSTEYSY